MLIFQFLRFLCTLFFKVFNLFMINIKSIIQFLFDFLNEIFDSLSISCRLIFFQKAIFFNFSFNINRQIKISLFNTSVKLKKILLEFLKHIIRLKLLLQKYKIVLTFLFFFARNRNVWKGFTYYFIS